MTDALGKKVEELRKDAGYSMRQFGKMCNLSHSYINDIEKGRTNPSIETLKIIAEKLNTTISYLMGESNDKRANKKSSENNETENSILKEIEGLSSESKKELKKYIKLLKIKDEMDKGKDEQSSTLEKNA